MGDLLKYRFCLLLIPLLFLSSCVSTYDLLESHATDVIRFSTDDLSGNYVNSEDSIRRTLWATLYSSRSLRPDKTTIPDNAIINLHFESDKKLIAKAIVNDTVLNRVELKGKRKGDYFSIKRKLLVIPIPAFWIHQETKVVLGKTQNGDVVVKYGDFNAGWILIMAGGGLHGYNGDTYAKLDRSPNK